MVIEKSNVESYISTLKNEILNKSSVYFNIPVTDFSEKINNTEFYYEANTDRFGVYLAERYVDISNEDTTYYPIFGKCDDQGVATSYEAFSRAS